MSEIVISNTRPEHFAQLARHQQICFPTLDPNIWMNEEHFASQVAHFPEGQHVALDGERVVGQSSTFRVSGEQAMVEHRFEEIMGHGYFTTHDPNGEWLYGADMSVHPDYRGRKISKMLYNARKDLCRHLNLRGIVAGGQLPGYHHYREEMSIDEYLDKVARGEIIDPTLTAQLRSGFVVRGVIRNYLEDTEHGSEASLIVWDNPDYREP